MYYSGGDVDNGGEYACVGVGVYGKSLYLSLNFPVILNCYSLKIKSTKKSITNRLFGQSNKYMPNRC